MHALSDARREEIREALSAPMPSISTPFTREGEVNFEGIRSYVEFVLEGGAKTIMITHGDSLISVLTDEEVWQVNKAVV